MILILPCAICWISSEAENVHNLFLIVERFEHGRSYEIVLIKKSVSPKVKIQLR